ncbi:MAG: type II toxin-antitoxin system RelE/ParE family toxin [Lachnospiraceae bacterium]|nr:type II toxin-antitoxin system RelE/ParE family toxin [Lachnospiraceae bacterium]
MDKYNVSLTSRALRDLDDIYVYIAQTLLVPETALSLVDKIEKEILSLEEMPYRFPARKTGAYANKSYRQLFVGNYTVIYRVDEKHRQVIIVTIRYSPSQF